MRYIPLLTLFVTLSASAQKKPLDHTVYDSWQSITEKNLSKNGKIVTYVIAPQEGDSTLIIQETSGRKIFEVPRGYQAKITNDNRFVVFKIKPTYQQTRDAKIKRRRPDDMPKDSLGILDVTNLAYQKLPRIRSFKLPENGSGWVAFLAEKNLRDTSGKGAATTAEPGQEEGTELSLQNFSTGKNETFAGVTEYNFDKNGKYLLYETNQGRREKKTVVLLGLNDMKSKTILAGFNDAKNYAFDEAGTQVAFVAERDSSARAATKYYKLFHYVLGTDSAIAIADQRSAGIPTRWAVSENGTPSFSKSGKRIMFGLAPILPPRDTSLPEFERVSVDVWNYNDEDLQPAQLRGLQQELRRSYTAIWDWNSKRVIPLASKVITRIVPTYEGDGNVFYATTDSGKRVARQWQGFAESDVYAIDPNTGARTLIAANFKGNIQPSYTGKYLLMYDEKKKSYSVYNAETKKLTAAASSIKVPLYDEENDVPDDPNAYGIEKWGADDKYVLINDRYDVWKVDPENKVAPVNITGGLGRKNKISYRILNFNEDEKFYTEGQTVWMRIYDENDKSTGLAKMKLSDGATPIQIFKQSVNLISASRPGSGLEGSILKAEDADIFVFQKETFKTPANVYAADYSSGAISAGTQLSDINKQQQNYNWGTAELFKWKAYTGKLTEGIVYKPEDFDPKKKYPMIVYFYERGNNTLHNYIAPAPTPSRLNISFFVSRGYVVFVPDIWYKTGYPGQSAYDYILSGTRAVVKQGFVDSTKIGLQGQSWGGYQIAYLITQTPLYAAAWAGAPVANMFSAYGGIRWESGVNRQFQYEKTQSRIGATIWERPDLYTANSPLFHLKKVKTPLVIMANDADGAVPWYQGIEMFTAMRRLNKPVWLLNYNGEAHNLVERRNRKDIQIREQQFFDWKLKGEKPAKWLVEGVPAIMKGRDWGLSTEW
jgi:dienelactone hydrolase